MVITLGSIYSFEKKLHIMAETQNDRIIQLGEMIRNDFLERDFAYIGMRSLNAILHIGMRSLNAILYTGTMFLNAILYLGKSSGNNFLNVIPFMRVGLIYPFKR